MQILKRIYVNVNTRHIIRIISHDIGRDCLHVEYIKLNVHDVTPQSPY